jgi:hypothetical protein
MGKAKKARANQKRIEKEQTIQARKQSLVNFTKKSLMTLAIPAVVLLAGKYLIKDDSSHTEYSQPTPITAQTQDKKDISEYIDSTVFMESSKPSNVNVYFIFQQHSLEDESYTKKETAITRALAVKSQVSVYRILEDLVKNKGVQVISVEGVYESNLEDIVNPTALKDKLPPDKYSALKQIYESDEGIAKMVLNGQGAARAFGLLREDVYMIGFETFDSDAIEKMPLKERRAYLKKLANNGIRRSYESILKTLKQSERLYNEEKINNQNAALVIGEGHFEDYKILIDKGGNFPFNSHFIWTKGIIDQSTKSQDS